MTKDTKVILGPKESLARVKRKLGREKYRDLAALVLEHKIARTSPKKVKEEIKTKFGITVGGRGLPVFIKY